MLYVIGQIFHNKELVGYRFLDAISRKSIDVTLENVRATCSHESIGFENAVYKKDSGILVGTQGSLTNYQSLYDNGVFFGKNKLVICYEIIDKDTGK